jgi:hypothetical protein
MLSGLTSDSSRCLWSVVGFRLLIPSRIPLQKSAPHSGGALLCRADDALVDLNKIRIARADHPFRIGKAIHIDRDPAAVHEYEVRIPD